MIYQIALWTVIIIALFEALVIAIVSSKLTITRELLKEAQALYPPSIVMGDTHDQIQIEDDGRVKIYQGGMRNG